MLIVIAMMSQVIGMVLGLLGGGGSILTVPILVYIADMPAEEAVASSLVVVGITSAGAVLSHARAGRVEWKTGFVFGGIAMIGAFVGGKLAVYFPGWLLLTLFAALMLVTAILMLRKSRKPASAPVTDTDSKTTKPTYGIFAIAAQGLAVGAVTGLVGAGGGFLVVPALVILGGLTMHQAVGTSLLVIALNSSAGVFGHLSHSTIDWEITGMVAGIAVVGSIIGTQLSSKVPANTLRTGFAWFVLAMGIFILTKELLPMLT